MKDDKFRNSPYPPEYDEIELRNKIEAQNQRLKKEQNIEESIESEKGFKLLKKINEQASSIFNLNKNEPIEDEKKKKIGILITTLIILTLIVSAYYFLIYEPSQANLEEAQTAKLNELHLLYKGPLASATEAFNLEKEITESKNAFEVETIDIMGPATKDWKKHHQKAIETNHDDFNRTMASYETNTSKNAIMPVSEALNFVNNNDATILSDVKFEKPDTVSVPILISRLQASGGLLSVGSIVDVYTTNQTNQTNLNSTSPDISGCTILSILRYEESGNIESEYGKAQTLVQGNTTNPNENTETFRGNVLELIKGSLAGGYNEEETIAMLKNYGLKLSNYEREINLGELDAQYLLLVETPSNKVNYMLNNMENIILTIPTKNAPSWMVEEIQSSNNNK